MKCFRSRCSTAPAPTKIKTAKVDKTEKSRYLEQDDIKGFFTAVRSDPILIHRFINVPIDIVHHLANKMLDLLRTPWKEGLERMIMSFFEMSILDRIREREVDALFTHFIGEYKGNDDNLAFDYWKCLSSEQKDKVHSKSGSNEMNVKALYTEVNQNTLLKKRFSSMSLTSFAQLMKQFVIVLASKKVATEFSEQVEKLRKIEITDREFDEFAKLYFKICSPDPEHLAEVLANVVVIKNIIVTPSNMESHLTDPIF